MPQNVYMKSSAVKGKQPTTNSLALREIGINTNDGKIYIRQSGSSDVIREVLTTSDTWHTGSLQLSGSIGLTGSMTINGLPVVTGTAGYWTGSSDGKISRLGDVDVSGSLSVTRVIYDNSGSAGTNGQIIFSHGTGFLWGDNVADSSQAIIITGKNLSGATIEKGTPLYFTGSGTSGNIVGIYPADAGNSLRMPAGGVSSEQITSGSEGGVYIYGYISGVDTSAFNAGDDVFVAVGGGYTNIKPTGSALIQKLGNVEKVDASNGSGVIQGPSWYNDLPNWEQGRIKVGRSNGQPVTSSFIYVDESNQTLKVTGSITLSQAVISGSGANRLQVYGSGSTLFEIIGSQGTLFSIEDTMTGSLYSVADSSGYTVLDVWDNGEVYFGHPQLNGMMTTAYTNNVPTGGFHLARIDTVLFDSVFVDYTIKSASLNMRAGSLIGCWDGAGNVTYTDTSTADLGNSQAVTMSVYYSQSYAYVKVNTLQSDWNIRTILKTI